MLVGIKTTSTKHYTSTMVLLVLTTLVACNSHLSADLGHHSNVDLPACLAALVRWCRFSDQNGTVSHSTPNLLPDCQSQYYASSLVVCTKARLVQTSAYFIAPSLLEMAACPAIGHDCHSGPVIGHAQRGKGCAAEGPQN